MAATENTSRNMWGINGIVGMLIATALLLSILAFLVTKAIEVERAQSTHYYDPTPLWNSLDNVKMISKDNAKFSFVDAKPAQKGEKK
ncbi:DUF4006 family protein [Nitratifractor salsuginis]|uniref:Periplasmic protein n=1 Tax=Nitratifractor salsuginis (strain DSM 16511 / JCM 12458 / E9I37-1) TaxID=749222 RepID=E6X2H3_NITSE|nr:DUF4006 family protein [Nitratifractor salsuginis]ADV47178.1 hypothetical protein Nitsa_1935 [Nitratifractor salsuginis DSM 16511]